jgi:hypothetical protein
MAKKTKRQLRSSADLAAAAGAAPRSAERDFNPDYSYVVKDLRRIGLLAGTFFVVLVVLSFLL